MDGNLISQKAYSGTLKIELSVWVIQ
jgi:hypothetical protein